MTQPHRLSHASERGFVLVAVLWLLAALTALTVTFTLYLSSSARALSLNDAALQTEALVSAGVELTAYQLQLAGENGRPSRGEFHTRLNGAELAVSYVSETARIDLNAAPKELLAGLLSALGARQEDARQSAERMVAWRTSPTPETASNEDALYQAAGRAYLPRQAPFAHVNELALVLGIPPALVQRAMPFVTVFSGAAGVDVATAEPEVVAALPGMTPLVLKQFLGDRASMRGNSQAIAAALGAAKASATDQKSPAYRLQIRVRFPNGREVGSEVVISVRGGGEDPYRVLSWRDEGPVRRRAPARL